MIKGKFLRHFFNICVFFGNLTIISYAKADLISGMQGMSGMLGMEGMVAMYGMDSMTGTRNVSYGFIAGNILGSRGWYERRENGQLILYPTTNLYNGMYGINASMMGMGYMSGMNSMDNMVGMSNMTSMLGGMSPAGSSSSAAMVSNTGKMSGSSQGWYWITPTGQLILTPVYNVYGTVDKIETNTMTDDDLGLPEEDNKLEEDESDSSTKEK